MTHILDENNNEMLQYYAKEMRAALVAELIERGYNPNEAQKVHCTVRAGSLRDDLIHLDITDPHQAVSDNFPLYNSKSWSGSFNIKQQEEITDHMRGNHTHFFTAKTADEIFETVNGWLKKENRISPEDIQTAAPKTPDSIIQAGKENTIEKLHPKIAAAIEKRPALPAEEQLKECAKLIEDAVNKELKKTQKISFPSLTCNMYFIGKEQDTIRLEMQQLGNWHLHENLPFSEGWVGSFRSASSDRTVKTYPENKLFFNAQTLADMIGTVNEWLSKENKIDANNLLGKSKT